VGVDSQTGRLALLKAAGSAGGLVLEVVTLPAHDTMSDFPSSSARTIPADRVQGAAALGNRFQMSVGFLADIGPAVYVGGRLFFWDESGQLEERDVVDRLHEDMRIPAPRAEFAAGQLQLIHINWMRRDGKIRLVRLTSDALKADPVPMQESYISFDNKAGEPLPVIATHNGQPRYIGLDVRPYAESDQTPGLPVEKPASNENEQQQTLLSAWLGRSDGGIDKLPLAVVSRPVRPPSPLAVFERRPATINSVEDADALIYKIDGPEFHIIDVADSGKPVRRSFTIEPSDKGHWEVHSASFPLLQPPLAATRSGEHWRVAWLAGNGVWAVETDGIEGGAAVKKPRRPLLAGDTGGVRLQFALQGKFLILVQQKQWGSPISIRAWDLRSAWRDQVNNADQRQLVEFACKLLRSEGVPVDLSEVDAEQFQIPDSDRKPCSMGDSGK
jgi:hypothetical protein